MMPMQIPVKKKSTKQKLDNTVTERQLVSSDFFFKAGQHSEEAR